MIRLLLVCLTGCQLLQRVRADKVVIMTWVQQPTLEVAPFDRFPDNGAVIANAYFGQISPTLEPTPISGAFAAFFGAGKKYDMTERDAGFYTISSTEDDRLIYDTDENRRYGFKACPENRDGCIGEEYAIKRILAAPRVDRAAITFEPPLAAPTLPGFDGAMPTGRELTIVFPTPTDDNRYRPLVTVLGVNADQTQPPGIIYNSMPTGGADLVKFVTEEPPLRVTIPADRFNAPGVYAVLVASARLNLDTSDNLFLGSGAIAGAANAFFIETQGEALPLPDNGFPNLPF